MMIPISDAIGFIKREIIPLESESVPIDECAGRILAEDIFADMDMPPFDRSQMDGFAVKAKDVKKHPVKLKIVGESVAGKGWHNELKTGEAVRIMTGAAVPKGADSVQKVEVTEENEGFIKIFEPTKKWQNIVKKGEEIHDGDKIFESGTRISENMIASLASFGYAKIKVSKKPKVAILATGSEIVDISEKPSQDQIRNSNSWMLRAFAEKANSEVELLKIQKDDLEELKKIIKDSSQKYDLLIISGGVSVGDYDFTKPALRKLGAEIFFEKVSLKPGKPTVFAKLDKTPIFGLPGNPVSAAVTFFIFVRTALMQMQNANQPGLRKGYAKLRHDIKGAKGRDSMLPVSFSTSKKGRLLIETLRFSGSSNFISFAKADGLVFMPADKALTKQEIAEIYFLP